MSIYTKTLLNKINNRSLNIGVIGVGYVGIKLVLAFAKNKNKIYCFDSDQNKIGILKKKKSPFSYIRSKEIAQKLKYIDLSNDIKNISNCDVIIICLPTPLKKNKPDISHIIKNWQMIKTKIKTGQLLILESTTYPGCTEEVFYDFLNKKFIIDKNIFLGYSPERENPGDKEYDFLNTPKVVSGIGPNSLKLCKKVYEIIVKQAKIAKTIRIAEASKLFENIYRSINIALINELKIACEHLNLNAYNIIDIAGTKPFGFSKFYPGPGIGGHCIPIDPLYFSWISKKSGFEVKFIELSAKINKFRTNWIITQIKKILKKSKSKVKKVLLLGMAYKKNIEDTRESASIKIFSELMKLRSLDMSYYDPYVKKIQINKVYLKSKNNLNDLEKYDLIILSTDHDKFNYNKIIKSNKILIDLRGRFKDHGHKKNVHLL